MAKPKKRRHRKLDRSLSEMRPNAGGIDMGATEIFAAVPADRDSESVRSFPSFTQDLHELADWLQRCRVDTVAMESTGVYWIPLFQILEARGIEVHLVNAQHVHHVPGRKSDVLDCQWLQYLHSVGLLKASFRPEHIFTLKQSLTAYRYYQQLIADCDQEIQQRIQAFDTKDDGPTAAAAVDSSNSTTATPSSFDLHSHLERIFGVDLTRIPGFECLRIQTIFSELGADLSKFPTDDGFCSWLNLCPKDGSSAGRRIRGPKVKTKNRVAQAFRLAAQSLHHSQSYLGDYYRSQRARHGAVKAAKNTAHKLARIFYHLVTTRQPYDETVFAKLEARNRTRRLHKLQSLAKQMGYSLVEANA